MARHIVNELHELINQQIQARELLGVQLFKAEAMAYVASEDGFLDCPCLVTNHYLWALKDLIEQIRAMNEEASMLLLRRSKDVEMNMKEI